MFILLKVSACNITKQEHKRSYGCSVLEAAGETVTLNIREGV